MHSPSGLESIAATRNAWRLRSNPRELLCGLGRNPTKEVARSNPPTPPGDLHLSGFPLHRDPIEAFQELLGRVVATWEKGRM